MLVTSTTKPCFFLNSNNVYTLKSVLKWFRVGNYQSNNPVSTQFRNRHHRISETKEVNKQFGIQHYLLTERAPKRP